MLAPLMELDTESKLPTNRAKAQRFRPLELVDCGAGEHGGGECTYQVLCNTYHTARSHPTLPSHSRDVALKLRDFARTGPHVRGWASIDSHDSGSI